jgi:serine/threonine-protein kinase
MDLRDQLQRHLGAAYTIERELGGGGMSRVFLAEETALGRQVVIKVLSPDLAAGVSSDRFTREIRFAASLQQANIVPVLATGAFGGLPYFTMPFVQGLSLRERLSRGDPLPIGEAFSILRDVVRALAYAHERGIVHRDVKPENVLLSGDTAVVTDFGIAKAVSVARTQGAATLTQAGTTVGTPAYMSPEQATADPNADHRADLYSFGCMAYELLTGASPFHGPSIAALIRAHISEQPVPLSSLRPDCPPAIEHVVMQCLEKDPERRPASARDVLHAFDVVTTPTPVALPRSFPRRTAGVAAALAIVAIGAIVALMLRHSTGPAAGPKSLAVLPFANIGGDSAQEYLAEGMSDELTTALGKVNGVQVAARTMAHRYRNLRDVDARDAGRTLGVAYILQGSVRSAGNTLRVSAQLADAGDGHEIWADTYDRSSKDVFAVQDEITRAIMGALQQRLTPRASQSVAQSAQGTSNSEAYDMYLRGRYLLQRRGPGVVQSIDRFQRAIELDSTFGRAYAALSEALELTPYFASVPAPAVRDRARKVARHALALDSSLVDAHVALGLAHLHAWEWPQAGEEFRRAIAIDSSDATARVQYARFLLYTSKFRDAQTQLERAKTLDPNSALVYAWLGQALLLGGRREAAMTEFSRALEIDSTNAPALQMSSLAYAAAGNKTEARRLAEGLRGTSQCFLAVVAYVTGATGDRSGALKMAKPLEAKRPRPWCSEFTIGNAYLGIGDTAKALDALERATAAGEIWVSFNPLASPLYDPVRGSPRFAALVRRTGLDERTLTSPQGGRTTP